MTNTLSAAASPYLRQHAADPVAWSEWGAEAFARAQREDKPLFVSIGYATCHWCHVMGRESFSRGEIAERLNRDFIPVKVDREERPDVDRAAIAYVQSITGGAGWPLHVWLTPEGRPFFGGTYFPPEDRHGRRGLPALLDAVTAAWKERRGEVLAEAERAGAALAAQARPEAGEGVAPALHETAGDAFERGFLRLLENFDPEHGGFGPAPRFPRSGNIDFLLRASELQGGDATEAGREALRMAAHTLRRMAEGGIQDHVGGGFHRYAVDEAWAVPHFEKMLPDQALIVRNLLEAARLTRDERYAWVARGTLDYLMRDLAHPGGAFFAGEDADSDGADGRHAEGAFYVWMADEIARVLPRDSAALVVAHFGVEQAGNVPAVHDPHGEFTGRNILRQTRPLAETAATIGLDPVAAAERLAEALDLLRGVRSARPRPALDDQIVAAWNGLALSALARAAIHPAACLADKRPFYLEAALRCARFMEAELIGSAGEVRRVWRKGAEAGEGFAEDHAGVVAGLLDLHRATLDSHWLRLAERVQARMDALFWDESAGGYFATAAGESPVPRLMDDHDGAEPAASSMALANLVRLSVLAGEPGSANPELAPQRVRAARLAEAFRARWSDTPLAMPVLLCGMADLLAEPAHVVLAGDPAAPGFAALADAARETAVAVLTPRCAAWAAEAGRDVERPVAFVCRGGVCLPPVSEVAALRRSLAEA